MEYDVEFYNMLGVACFMSFMLIIIAFASGIIAFNVTVNLMAFFLGLSIIVMSLRNNKVWLEEQDDLVMLSANCTGEEEK